MSDEVVIIRNKNIWVQHQHYNVVKFEHYIDNDHLIELTLNPFDRGQKFTIRLRQFINGIKGRYESATVGDGYLITELFWHYISYVEYCESILLILDNPTSWMTEKIL